VARNGHHREVDLLKREAAERRAALRRTASALEERLRERTQRVTSAARRTRETWAGVDDFIHRNRYLVIGGAVGLGAMLALRGRRRRTYRARSMDQAVRFVVERPRTSPVRSLLGAVSALALRQGLAWLGHRLEECEDERLMLPPGRPYAE